ncbi:MAG: NfeD family protein [Pirellulales bacterium]
MDPIIWAVGLMLIGIALIVLEIFIPSGGILGFLAFSAVLAAVIMAFQYSGTTTGLAFSGFAVVALPLAVMLSLKWLPNTSIGRRLLLISDDEDTEQADEAAKLRELIGEIGVAKSLMLPGGTVQVNRRNYDAVSEGGMPIEPNQAVEVVQVRHERLVVRPSVELPRQSQQRTAEDDIMNQPLDSLGLDDEPLA